MPYRRAHWIVIALIPLTVLAFWPSYFSSLGEASLAHHVHGLTGTAWLLLVAGQSWTIHNGRRGLHRLSGMSAFLLAPLMVAGFALASHAGAVKAVADHPFYVMFGEALLTADLWLLFATPLVIYLAFRHRRRVRVHSALMLSTLIGLLPPILARLFSGFVPGMTIRGPETLHRFGYCLAASMILATLGALVLYRRSGRDGWPWLLAAGITGASYLLYLTVGQTGPWRAFVEQIAALPAAGVAVGGLVLGLAACVAGWYGVAGVAPAATRKASAEAS